MDLEQQLAILDRALALERLGGDEDLLREIAGLFLEDCPRLVDEVRGAAACSDAAKLHRAAHTLRGAVANFSADAVVEAAYRLEQMGRAGDLAGVDQAFRILESRLECLRPALLELQQAASRPGAR